MGKRAEEVYRFRGGKLASPLPEHRVAEAKAAAARQQAAKGSNGSPPAAPSEPFADGAAGGTEGRDAATGRFMKGWRGGPGNPFARQVAARRKALLDAVSPEDVAAVGKELLLRSLAGDVTAAKVLLSYVVGNPAPVPDPDRLDADELRLLLDMPTADIASVSLFNHIAPWLAVGLARMGLIQSNEEWQEKMAQILAARERDRMRHASLEDLLHEDDDD